MEKKIYLDRLKVKFPAMYSFYDYTNLPDSFAPRDKINIRCPLHGIFIQAAHNHSSGHGCAECKRDKKRRTQADFVKLATLKHNGKYDYSDSVYLDSRLPIKIRCPIHGVFELIAQTHLNGLECQECRPKRGKLTNKVFIESSRLVHGNRYDYSKVDYSHSQTKVEIICRKHGSFFQRPNDHLKGFGCKICKESSGEREIREYLISQDIAFIQEYSFYGSKYRYDFYLYEHNVLIEFHGMQHFKPIEHFGGRKGLKNTKKRDKEKVLLARKRRIPLIELTYREQKNGSLLTTLASQLSKHKPMGRNILMKRSIVRKLIQSIHGGHDEIAMCKSDTKGI